MVDPMLTLLLRDTWFRIGLLLAVFGCGPLLVILLLHTLGLLSDPNPNPVGPGLLFFFTAWPAIICLGVGVLRVRRPELVAARAARPPVHWTAHPAVRITAGLFGALLLFRGVFALLVVPQAGRGPAEGIVVGIALVWWAMVGKAPWWWGRRA